MFSLYLVELCSVAIKISLCLVELCLTLVGLLPTRLTEGPPEPFDRFGLCGEFELNIKLFVLVVVFIVKVDGFETATGLLFTIFVLFGNAFWPSYQESCY